MCQERLPGNEEGSGTEAEIALVATLSNDVFEGAHEVRASPRGHTRPETSSKQFEHLIREPYGLGQNPPPTGDYMYTHGHITRTLGTRGTVQHENVNVEEKYKPTPLHLALKGGDVEFAQVLIEQGADVNAEDDSKWTPLHRASDGGHVVFAQMLIEHGANMNAQDNSESTPLHLASSGGHVEVAQVLI